MYYLVMTHKLNVSKHMLIMDIFLVLVCAIRAQTLSATFSSPSCMYAYVYVCVYLCVSRQKERETMSNRREILNPSG
jgi:membrane protein YdbS with pleckstrin-like domain